MAQSVPLENPKMQSKPDGTPFRAIIDPAKPFLP